MDVTRDTAVKVLEVVDAGLVRGVGDPEPGKMCVEAAVCYAMGLPHGDNPECVSPALRALKIQLNDKEWSSNQARAKGLRRLAIAQLGSRGALDEKEFLARVVEMTIRKIVPRALRSAASAKGNAEHAEKLEAAAVRCEAEGTKAAAYAANAAAYAAYADANAADAAAYAVNAAAYAAAYAAANAAAYAANAAAYAAYAAAYAAANAAVNAAFAAAYADAADAANDAAKKKARDEALAFFAEEVVQILIAMKAPGTAWLDLTEVA